MVPYHTQGNVSGVNEPGKGDTAKQGKWIVAWFSRWLRTMRASNLSSAA